MQLSASKRDEKINSEVSDKRCIHYRILHEDGLLSQTCLVTDFTTFHLTLNYNEPDEETEGGARRAL